jgi:ribosomal protein S18 acetylase RimI-like enzyme
MDFRAPTRADVPDIVAMLLACDLVDFGVPDYDSDALLAEWAQPEVDVARDAFLTDGAYGILLGNMVRAWVHPSRRGQGLGAEIAARLEARARERGLAHVEQQAPSRTPAARALLEQRGYERVRAIAELRLDAGAAAALGDPAGAAPVRVYDPARDEAALQALFERELAGGRARLVELDGVLAAHPDTSLWFCADAGDGSLIGGLRSELRPAGFITGSITQLAVAPAHRHAGIGRALVAAASRELAARGCDSIRVAVRSDTPDVRALFEAMGFRGEDVIDEMRLALA